MSHQVFILAHQYHEKLEPFTATRPACLIPVLNRPVLFNVIDMFLAKNIENITVVAHDKAGMVEQAIASDGAYGKVRIHTGLGIPDGLDAGDEIILADAVIYSYENLVTDEFLQGDESPCVLLAKNVNPLYHYDFSGKQITGEQQQEKEGVVAGIIRIRAGDVEKNLPTVQDLARNVVRGSHSVFSAAPFIYMEYPWEILGANFLGLDTWEKYPGRENQISKEAAIDSRAILEGTNHIEKGVTVKPGAYVKNATISAGTTVGPNAYIEKAFIGRNSIVGPAGYVLRSCLGKNSKVGTPSECPWCVGFDGFSTGHHCHTGMGVFGEKTSVNAGAIVTANRWEMVKVKVGKEFLDSGWSCLGAFVGDRAKLNANSIIMPGRKIGHDAVVGPGVVLYRDLEPNKIVVLKQETVIEDVR